VTKVTKDDQRALNSSLARALLWPRLHAWRVEQDRFVASGPQCLGPFGTENAPMERFRGASAAVVPHPCSVLTPYPSPRAFIACTAATEAAAVVK
jgi:hypothetical protein